MSLSSDERVSRILDEVIGSPEKSFSILLLKGPSEVTTGQSQSAPSPCYLTVMLPSHIGKEAIFLFSFFLHLEYK